MIMATTYEVLAAAAGPRAGWKMLQFIPARIWMCKTPSTPWINVEAYVSCHLNVIAC